MVGIAEIENIVVNIIGLPTAVLKFPDLIFYVIIPFVIVAYASYYFLESLRIFKWANIANKILGVVLAFVMLRFIMFPFIASILFLFVKIKGFLKKIGFVAILLFLYIWLFPFLSGLV